MNSSLPNFHTMNTNTNVVILPITGCSDGDPLRRPPPHFVRNDAYYLEQIATQKWAKDLGIWAPNVTFRLDSLPAGYACFEKTRENDTKHVDRYVYGHPKAPFRSLTEFYPHFKFLMEHDSPAGCPCKVCTKGYGTHSSAPRRVPTRSPNGANAPPRPSLLQTASQQAKRPPKHSAQSRTDLLEGRPAEPASKRRKVGTDREGTPDVFAHLIRKLESTQSDGIDESIAEYHSPDWRAGHNMLVALLNGWKALPAYVPRVGELVLFLRPTTSEDTSAQHRRWEAGVVSQMTDEKITAEDLKGIPAEKERSNVTLFGFRVEPFAPPKSTNTRHAYVPLHEMRPLYLFKEVLQGVEEKDWHPTIPHALKIMSSFCLVSRHHFKGKWPNASIFSEGLYIGSEIVLGGDFIRLQPLPTATNPNVITDILQVTGIQLCILNLDDPDVTGWDPEHPYQTCLHIRGRPYSLDPARSFGGNGKTPVSPSSGILPTDITAIGQWYHVLDPQRPKMRVETPFTRVLGRCPTAAALKAWSTDSTTAPTTQGPYDQLSRGLDAILEGRAYSIKHDARIQKLAVASYQTKTWLWADNRVEQLDLHEINNVSVGAGTRGPLELLNWRHALEALNGNKRALEKLQAAQLEQQREQQLEQQLETELTAAQMPNRTSFGSSQVATSSAVVTMARNVPALQVDSDSGDGPVGRGDKMEVDVKPSPAGLTSKVDQAAGSALPHGPNLIEIDSDSDDSDEAILERFGV